MKDQPSLPPLPKCYCRILPLFSGKVWFSHRRQYKGFRIEPCLPQGIATSGRAVREDREAGWSLGRLSESGGNGPVHTPGESSMHGKRHRLSGRMQNKICIGGINMAMKPQVTGSFLLGRMYKPVMAHINCWVLYRVACGAGCQGSTHASLVARG